MAELTGKLNPRSQRAWDSFRRRVAELGGVVLEPEWLGVHVPHRCRCVKGHECSPQPGSVQRGLGICRICANQDPATARENFYRRIAEMNGEVLETEWLGAMKPHRCRCAAGHECQPWPSSIQQGQGMCRVCAGTDPAAAWENFQRRVAEADGVVFELTWLGALVPHRCRCAKGHKCSPLPNGVQQGEGICRVCAREAAGRKRSLRAEDSFREQVAKVSGVILETEWLGSGEPHRCRCARRHECSPRPADVQRGHGICWICACWEQSVVYVTRNPVSCHIKFGITGRGSQSRLNVHRRNGFTEVIRLEAELPEGIAPYIEHKIKVALAMADVKPVQGCEYFSDEYIALVLNEIDNWVP